MAIDVTVGVRKIEETHSSLDGSLQSIANPSGRLRVKVDRGIVTTDDGQYIADNYDADADADIDMVEYDFSIVGPGPADMGRSSNSKLDIVADVEAGQPCLNGEATGHPEHTGADSADTNGKESLGKK